MLLNKYRLYKTHAGIMLIVILFGYQNDVKSQSNDWEVTTKQFIKDYKDLNLPLIQLSFIENIKRIKSKDSILIQENVFKSMESILKKVDKHRLSEKETLEYELLLYECELNQERIILEKQWINDIYDSFPTTKVYDLPNGKEWYEYFLKKWVDKETSPEQVYALGIKEIKKVKARIKEIQIKSGMDSLAFRKHITDSSFFYTNSKTVQNSFFSIKETVDTKLPGMFPFLDKIPDMKIKQGTNVKLSQVPGFYSDKTFYFNYFNNSFNKRQVGWLYIHEGMPGHHYQKMVELLLPQSDVQKLFQYRGVGEGWAAYVEELGNEIGAYQNIYDELGKWEWDIIRSVRVVMDVGLNYYGWNDEKALSFWKQHIKEQDDIALREIRRMKRWPAQVITYKYGSNRILKWKSELEKNKNFNLKEFHRSILKNGLLPYSILKRNLEL